MLGSNPSLVIFAIFYCISVSLLLKNVEVMGLPYSKTFFWSQGQGSMELDRMVNLIIDRLLLAEKVAVAKWDNKQQIEDQAREKIILDKMVQDSKSMGLSEGWAREFFRDQMEANKAIQYARHKEWTAKGQRPRGPAVNLSVEVRPQIDALNSALLRDSKTAERERGGPHCSRIVGDMARVSSSRRRMDEVQRGALSRAIKHVCS